MERAPEDTTLGALGFAGICRETLLVLRSSPPGFRRLCVMVIALSLSLLAHVAVSRVLFSLTVTASDGSGTGFVCLAANLASFLLAEASLLSVILYLSLHLVVPFSVLSVATRYSDVDRDARTVARDLRQVSKPIAKKIVSVFPNHTRLAVRIIFRTNSAEYACLTTSRDSFLLLLGYTVLFVAAAVLMHLPRAALLLVGGTAYLVGAAYIVAVWHLACVLSVLEDGTRGFGAMHRSDELLWGAGKFWAAAAVFTVFDICAVTLQLAFGALVVDDRIRLCVWLRVAVGAVMAVALWTVVLAGLVAPVVVYFVCKGSDITTKRPTDVGRKGRGTPNRKRR